MKTTQVTMVIAIGLLLLSAPNASAQDWVQWRGENRDGIARNFETPDQWPTELVKQWSVEIGDGIASPSIKGDKVYVMALQDGNEVMRCLNADTGKEIWKDQYAARAASGPAAGFAGTRSSPAIGNGKVVALGVDGTASCWDAESGKLLWQNDDHRGQVPRFSTSSSPLIADQVCVMQFGDERDGGIVAYDLESGAEKWAWTENGSSYASPVLMTLGDQRVVLAAAATKLVAVALDSGESVWSMDYTQGRYNAATPVVDGQTVYLAGPSRGITAFELVANGDTVVSNDKWRNEDTEATVQYNSPVLFEGNLFGLSNANQLFCVNVETGDMSWNQAVSGTTSQSGQAQGRGNPGASGRGAGGNRSGDAGQRGGRQGGGRRGRGGGGGRGGYGSIVSAGSVLMGLTPGSELFVFQADGSEFTELARYKVSETPTYAYPVPVGNRIYVKDQDSLTLWTLD